MNLQDERTLQKATGAALERAAKGIGFTLQKRNNDETRGLTDDFAGLCLVTTGVDFNFVKVPGMLIDLWRTDRAAALATQWQTPGLGYELSRAFEAAYGDDDSGGTGRFWFIPYRN